MEGRVPIGVAHDDDAIAEECLFPVSAWCADGQEVFDADPGVALFAVLLQSVNGCDAPLSLCAFEDGSDVVLSRDSGFECPMAPDSCPFSENVHIIGEVHLVDDVCASWPACNFAKYGFSLGCQEPLHVHKSRLHLHGFDDVVSELDAWCEVGEVEVVVCDLHGADPLIGAHHEWFGEVFCDADEERTSFETEGIKCKFAAFDALFATDFGDVT